jgi:hypothetical protein
LHVAPTSFVFNSALGTYHLDLEARPRFFRLARIFFASQAIHRRGKEHERRSSFFFIWHLEQPPATFDGKAVFLRLPQVLSRFGLFSSAAPCSLQALVQR